MDPERSDTHRRPAVVTAAFWLQLAVAAAILAPVVVGALAPDFLRALRWPPLETGLALALAAWLAFSAVGLRRGDRVARQMSLAGLAVLLLAGVTAGLLLAFGPTTYETTATYTSAEHETSLLVWILLSYLVGVAAVPAGLALSVAGVVLLMTGPARRYFSR